jgi:hypothetical protein
MASSYFGVGEKKTSEIRWNGACLQEPPCLSVLTYHLPVRFKGIFLKGVSEAEHLKDSRGSSLNTQIIEIN